MKITPEIKARLEAAGHQAALLYIDALAARQSPVGHIIMAIHPFRDGNGRIARCMLNYVFRYFDLPYVVIPVEARDRYLNALEAANQGNLQLLADLIIERYEHSLDQLLTQALSPTLR